MQKKKRIPVLLTRILNAVKKSEKEIKDFQKNKTYSWKIIEMKLKQQEHHS